jgi:predicted SnoaL-like aldol condensation-catalyzing enzyme
MARGLLATWNFTAHRGNMLLAVVASGIGATLDTAPAQSQERAVTTSSTLGATARRAMSDIFQKKDATAVDRYFGESFIQHDPSIADGLAGMKSFVAEATNSPTAGITTYRTLVDGDFALLHSRYQGVARYAGPAVAFDLFRFQDGKIVEHWGGQEPEAPPNLSGRTQVDGPTEVLLVFTTGRCAPSPFSEDRHEPFRRSRCAPPVAKYCILHSR